jgi:hypothetical protein
MLDPASGPFLFDTSAESWLARPGNPGATDWMRGFRGFRDRVEKPVHAVAFADPCSMR